MLDAQRIAARVEQLRQHTAPGAGLVIAFSGGRDSSVLLDVIAQAGMAPIRAVFIDHGLQPEVAARWHAHVEQFCRDRHVPLHIEPVIVSGDAGDGIEAAARKARYAALSAQAAPGELLLVAQHESDQAETLLLQLFRGAGPDGLAAMPAVSTLDSAVMARPLLDVSSDDIQAYATAHDVHWFDDPSNALQRFDRNYLRHTVLPLIRERWPGVDQTLSRAARWQAEGSQLQQQLAAGDMRHLTVSPQVLDTERMAQLPSMRQRNALRFAIRCGGLSLPSATRLAAVQTLALQPSGRGSVQWTGGVVLRYRTQLHLLCALPPEPADGWSQPLVVDRPVLLPHALGRLTLEAAAEDSLNLTIRFRAGGERVRLATGKHHALAKWFQERGVPPWQRSRTPLIFAGTELVAIGTEQLSGWPAKAAASRLIWHREIVS